MKCQKNCIHEKTLQEIVGADFLFEQDIQKIEDNLAVANGHCTDQAILQEIQYSGLLDSETLEKIQEGL